MTDTFLDYVKTADLRALVSHMNVVGSGILVLYPLIEEKTWTIQKYEAEAYLASDPRDPSLAPYLSRVCFYHHGEAADEAELIAQLDVKASEVKANDIAWLEAAAITNGLRAKAQDQMESATTEAEVHEILHNTTSELSALLTPLGVY